MISDIDRIRPRAYIHRHKLNPRDLTGSQAQGPNEVKLLWELELEPLLHAHNKYRATPLLREKPHITFDNHFSGDAIFNYAATHGFGLTMTVARNRLPTAIPNKYLQKETTGTDLRSRMQRYQQPIFCIRKHNGSEIQYTSFQSTGPTNIMHVNAINSLQLYVDPKERGRGDKKRTWAIEMNESRRLYLNSYGAINRMDHLIHNCNMGYRYVVAFNGCSFLCCCQRFLTQCRTWKYWHAPMCHAKSMAVVVAYDMYLEVAEGNLNPAWKIANPVSFHRFREKLAIQMLEYDPRQRKYLGDEYQQHNTRNVALHQGHHFHAVNLLLLFPVRGVVPYQKRTSKQLLLEGCVAI